MDLGDGIGHRGRVRVASPEVERSSQLGSCDFARTAGQAHVDGPGVGYCRALGFASALTKINGMGKELENLRYQLQVCSYHQLCKQKSRTGLRGQGTTCY